VESASLSYKGHRYPVEVISHCVWLYHRFPLSFREVGELMLERGIVVSYETVRRWCGKFGQPYAGALRRRQPQLGDEWHLDEVFLKINGELRYLWRAIDQDGNVLDILVPNRRDQAPAGRFFRRLVKKTHAVPRVVVTDKLRSCGATHREVMPSVPQALRDGAPVYGGARHLHGPVPRVTDCTSPPFCACAGGPGQLRGWVRGRAHRHLLASCAPQPRAAADAIMKIVRSVSA
jgi:transposase-like protein